MTLKKFLQNKGYKFYGETDTEVVVNLISYHLEKEKEPFKALKNAVGKLEGSWGLVIIIKNKPNSLFISKSGSPLLLGRNEDGVIVASEISDSVGEVQMLFLLKRVIFWKLIPTI